MSGVSEHRFLLLVAGPFRNRLCGRRPLHEDDENLFLGSDGVLGGFGEVELCRSFCLDLDGLSGLRIASHAGLAMHLF